LAATQPSLKFATPLPLIPNNVASTIFYMKTKGKRRGYVERQEVEHNTNNITGIRLISE